MDVVSPVQGSQPSGAGPQLRPLIDCQPGSIRDDFDFGHVILLSREALNGLADAIETEHISGNHGGWYDLRLRPYRTVDDKIDGVVITFVDISVRRAVEEELRESKRELNSLKKGN